MASTPTTPLKAGDSVRLISGGPLMTVRTVGVDRLTCDWFLFSDHRYTGPFSASFPRTSLERA